MVSLVNEQWKSMVFYRLACFLVYFLPHLGTRANHTSHSLKVKEFPVGRLPINCRSHRVHKVLILQIAVITKTQTIPCLFSVFAEVLKVLTPIMEKDDYTIEPLRQAGQLLHNARAFGIVVLVFDLKGRRQRVHNDAVRFAPLRIGFQDFQMTRIAQGERMGINPASCGQISSPVQVCCPRGPKPPSSLNRILYSPPAPDR